MSKQSPKRRSFEIKKRQKKRAKLKKLKEKYFLAKTQEEKEKIIEKIFKIAPHIKIEQWLKKD